MTDIMSPEQRSRVMSRIRGKNTTPERYLDAMLDSARLEYRRHDRDLPGCPDFVFPHAKVVVFVDGDFWHGWRFPRWSHKLDRFWKSKIMNNRARDERNFKKLARNGWRVIRIWEHQVEQDVLNCVLRISRMVKTSDIDWEAIRARQQTLPTLRRRDRLPKT